MDRMLLRLYFSNAMAGPTGLALLLKNWSMVLGSGTWYGRANIDSNKTQKRDVFFSCGVDRYSVSHEFHLELYVSVKLTSDQPLGFTVELLHCIFAGTCSFPLLKVPAVFSMTWLFWHPFQVHSVCLKSLPHAGVCLLLHLPLLAHSGGDPAERESSSV